jgi:hypothetical protein
MQGTELGEALSAELNRLTEIAKRDSEVKFTFQDCEKLPLDLCSKHMNLTEEPDT